ncbi:MAG TPA: hypothetical protein DG761_01305 [Gammaproteobacteria bacterium]|nr:hypothetical protein [Gammaproteobacteria bacterium]
MALTEQKKQFYEHVFSSILPTNAAIKAKYSPNRARQTASDFMSRKKNPEGMAYLDGLRAAQSKRVEFTSDDWLREEINRAYQDIGQWLEVEKDGTRKLKCKLSELPLKVRRQIREVGSDPFGQVTVKMHADQPARNNLGRYLGMFKKHNEQIGQTIADIWATVNDD